MTLTIIMQEVVVEPGTIPAFEEGTAETTVTGTMLSPSCGVLDANASLVKWIVNSLQPSGSGLTGW